MTRRLLAASAALAVLVPVLPAATASGSAAPLAGTHRCAPGKYVLSVRVKGWSCRKGRQVATYWETTGRGHCPKGYAFRAYTKPAGAIGSGGSYLSCGRGGVRVFWVEGEAE